MVHGSLQYYAQHSPFTDPAEHKLELEALPAAVPALSEALNGLLIHVWKVRKWHPEWLQSRPHHLFTRRIDRLLDAVLSLDSQPLNRARTEERRAIVDCRSFAVLLCA